MKCIWYDWCIRPGFGKWCLVGSRGVNLSVNIQHPVDIIGSYNTYYQLDTFTIAIINNK
jgi:hypothetical protein